MKKLALFAIPGLIGLAFAAALLWPASPPTDSQIREQIIGTWALAPHPAKVIENKADGTMSVKVSGVETARGTWQVANGYIICATSKPSTNSTPPDVESNRVLSLSKNKIVLLSIDGQTPLTFYKQ